MQEINYFLQRNELQFLYFFPFFFLCEWNWYQMWFQEKWNKFKLNENVLKITMKTYPLKVVKYEIFDFWKKLKEMIAYRKIYILKFKLHIKAQALIVASHIYIFIVCFIAKTSLQSHLVFVWKNKTGNFEI